MKKVFELALSGRNTTQIAYGMNELNLPDAGIVCETKESADGQQSYYCPGQ